MKVLLKLKNKLFKEKGVLYDCKSPFTYWELKLDKVSKKHGNQNGKKHDWNVHNSMERRSECLKTLS